MPFAVVTVETEFGERVDLALPLDRPSREVADKVMHDVGRQMIKGETYTLYIPTGHGDKAIAPNALLGELGITDGQRLRIKRDTGVLTRSRAAKAGAYLRTETGTCLHFEGANVIIGRRGAGQQTPLDLDLTNYDPSRALSRRHASIGQVGSDYYLVDLQSTNGTQLNGENVPPGRKVQVHNGDVIEFGLAVRLTFVIPDSK